MASSKTSWQELVARYKAGDFDPSEWNWRVGTNSVSVPGIEGFVSRTCIYIMGEGAEQLYADFTMLGVGPNWVKAARILIEDEFGVDPDDVLEGLG